ncbi:MAG TPA: DNA polymerase III subunit delta' [Anaerolineales bacterium]|nr:DNA polymerase III subunit delta' [Anaerolineales bacterium]
MAYLLLITLLLIPSPSPSNWNLLGHEWAVQLLAGQLARGRLRHAYLITGPAGVGRRTLALALAQAINCPSPLAPGIPCQTCRTCAQIARQQHPDLTIVQAENVGGTLKVEQIRELQRTLNLAPYQAKYRVAGLLRFEEAHVSAANALLKTLEEPPPQVILLLTAESTDALLPTVTSRCEVLRLRPLAPAVLAQGLTEKWQIPPEEARILAHIADGLPGYAHYLHHHPEAMEQRQAWLDEHLHLLKNNRVARFQYAEKIAEDKPTLRQALRTWTSLWNDVLHLHTGLAERVTNLDRADPLTELAARVSLPTIRRALLSLDQALARLERNVNTRMTVEALWLDLPFL